MIAAPSLEPCDRVCCGVLREAIGQVTTVHAGDLDALVVVDDGNEDDTGLVTEKPGAIVIRQDRNLAKGVMLTTCPHDR